MICFHEIFDIISFLFSLMTDAIQFVLLIWILVFNFTFEHDVEAHTQNFHQLLSIVISNHRLMK